MEAKNLRIGNLYQAKSPEKKKYEQPYRLCSFSICQAVNNEIKLKGIPLTNDYLKRLGFTEFDSGAFALENSIYTVEFIRNHWHLLYRSNHVIAQPFRYVHDLQNLFFALTGTELELKTESSTCG